MKLRGSIGVLITVLAATLAVLALPSTASAAKVANPGPFNASVTGGFLRIKTQTFGFDPGNPITFAGTIDSQGNVNIPTSGQTYPPMPISTGGFDLTVRINPAQAITGTVNPLTGQASLRLRVWIKIDGVPLGGGCRIASASSPIDVNALITGTTSPPGPNGPITGTGYNADTGSMKIVNNDFSVPSSSDCGLAAGTVNGELGLPSASGNNEAQFELGVNPIIRRGITAALSVSGTSGLKPYTVDFDASASTRTAALRHYQWDFDGNGTFDRTTSGPTTSFTYTNAGVFDAKVRHIDVDGDFADATKTITVVEPPDLSIDSTHTDPFRVGTPGQYTLAARNNSVGPTTGQVTVTDTLPAGIVPTSASGTGWTCNIVTQVVTCTRSSIAGNTTAPNITVAADVTAAALPGGSNVATVSTAADSNAANNVDSDPTSVTAIDLSIDKSHGASFRPGTNPANTWSLEVTNEGTAATVGPITVTDTLPAGFAPVAASGSGWTCNIVTQTVTCTRAASLNSEATAPLIDIDVDVTIPSGETSLSATNTASVSTAGDAFSSNDSDADPTLAIDSPDARIVKSHTGNLTAGTNATYTLAVDNVGPQPTTGTTTVTDTLPTGLTFVSAAGTGWSCGAVGQDVTCDHADPIAADTSADDIELVVSVGLDAIPSVTNTATVATAGDDNPANDSSSDPAIVRAIDLDIDKTHDEPFRVGREGTYDLDVANIGDSDTVSSATVTDTLPAGLTYVGATGAGWSCNAVGQDVTCTHADPITAGSPAATIELVVDVDASAVPSVDNTATVSTTDDYNPANNSATDETAIVETDAAVSISRTGSFHSESTGTYLLAVDNDGVAPTVGTTTLTATLPAGLNFVSADGTGWTCNESAGVVTCEYADPIGAEESVPDVQLRVSIDRDAPASVTTTAEVSTTDDRNPDNDTASDTTSVTGPDVSVDSAHTGAFRVGGTGTYTLSVDNGGVDPTRGPTTVTDTLPAGLSFNSASGPGWDCSEAAGVVTCVHEEDIAASGSAGDITLEVSVAPAAAPAATNQVTVDTIGDRDGSNNSDSDMTNVEMIDLRLALDRDGAAVVGGEVDYQVAVDNVGDAATVGPARVTDTLPTGITPTEWSGSGWNCAIAGQEVECSHDASLAPSEQAAGLTITATVSASAANTSVNTASVATTDDGNPANDSDDDTATIVRTPDLSVTIDDQLPQSGSLRVGNEVGYRLTVLNQGGSPTTQDTNLSIELAQGLEFISADSAACTGSGRIVDCTFPAPINDGDRIDLTVQAAVTDEAGDEAITNATVNTTGDSDASDDEATVTSAVTRTDLLITKQYGGPWTAGRQATYAIGVENLGTAGTAGPVTVHEELPAGISFASSSGTGWNCRSAGAEVICEQTSAIPAGGVRGIDITVDVGDSAVPSVSGEATVDTRDDVDLSNNSTSDTVEVLERPEDREVGKIAARLAMKRARPTTNGIVYIRLLCPDEAENGCTGEVGLGSAKKVKTGGGKRKRVSFGEAPYDITQGHTQPVGIRLSKKHRDLLKKLGEVRAEVVITPTGLESAIAPLRLRSR